MIDISSLIDSYTKEELECIVSESFSFAEVLSKLGYSTKNGNNNKTLKKRLEYFNISTEHFTSHTGRKTWTDDEIFCENSRVSQSTLRRMFKKKELVPYKCAVCGLDPFWNGMPLVLTLDHINGRNKDNKINNLRWLCPNCDRQSSTYGMKNKKDLKKGVILCPGNYETLSNEDAKADKKNKEIISPDRQELKDKLWEFKNYTQVANNYNVSPTTIRRWCRGYNLPATINIIKHTSEVGWETENWNDTYKPNVFKEKQSIPCYMLDKTTEEILMEFQSRVDAAHYLNKNLQHASAHIGAVCGGHRVTAYGYKWKNK